MNIRKKLKNTNTDNGSTDLPVWVVNGSESTKLLFKAALQELSRIERNISTGDVSTIRNTKLILATITKNAGLSRSILHQRRQPELCQWVNKKNKELEVQMKRTKPKKKNTPSKAELQNELLALKLQIKDREQQELRAVVEEAFSSNLLDDRDKQAREIARLKVEKEILTEKLARSQKRNRDLSEKLEQYLNRRPSIQAIPRLNKKD